jgi:hypothetical protein
MTDERKASIDYDIDLALSRLMSQATLIVGEEVEATRKYVSNRLAKVDVNFRQPTGICSQE